MTRCIKEVRKDCVCDECCASSDAEYEQNKLDRIRKIADNIYREYPGAINPNLFDIDDAGALHAAFEDCRKTNEYKFCLAIAKEIVIYTSYRII